MCLKSVSLGSGAKNTEEGSGNQEQMKKHTLVEQKAISTSANNKIGSGESLKETGATQIYTSDRDDSEAGSWSMRLKNGTEISSTRKFDATAKETLQPQSMRALNQSTGMSKNRKTIEPCFIISISQNEAAL